MTTRKSDPALAFQYGISMTEPFPITGNFTEISGLGEENEVIEHKVINADGVEHIYMIPGRWKPNPITLKRGVTGNMDLWKWRSHVRNKTIDKARAYLTISLYKRDYTPILRWHLFDAWPSKLSGPEFRADSNEIAVEEITLVYENIALETL